MADDTNSIMRELLLQDGVSCAIATLHAIESAELFRAVPSGDAADGHNHGCHLLDMLETHLRQLQRQVDALSGIPAPAKEGC